MFSSLVEFFAERKETKAEERKNEILRIIEEDNGGVRHCTDEFFYGSTWDYHVLVKRVNNGFLCSYCIDKLVNSFSYSRKVHYEVVIKQEDSLFRRINLDYRVYENKQKQLEKERLLHKLMEIENELKELNAKIYKLKKRFEEKQNEMKKFAKEKGIPYEPKAKVDHSYELQDLAFNKKRKIKEKEEFLERLKKL